VLDDGVQHPSLLFGASGARVAGASDDPDTLYVAFAARTSDDELQDPTISIPRQLQNCRRALPPNAVIVAFFWDVESGRKELDVRGTGAHDKFDIAVPRDGGLPELLAEAKRKDRRFDAVICESVDRIARLMHQSTQVEHELDRVGVPLFAADEGVETTRRKSTKILVRRTKQMLAEWYVRQLLELSWDGYCEHTRQGWNIGVPPYGYTGERVPDPVPAKREQGMSKTRLLPDPDLAPVVHQIFVWRVTEGLAYRAIADRLNLDLDRYPPKKCARPGWQRGSWSPSSVREVLSNPKYTGYMVWNRRASKTGNGKHNHPRDWVWSPMPTHEPLVTFDLFKAARAVGGQRVGSRNGSDLNVHPFTKRSYVLRSYVRCAQCERRMAGRMRQTRAYMVCQPSTNHGKEAALRFPGHPPTVYVRQDVLLDGVIEFLADRVLGPNRAEYALQERATGSKRHTGLAKEAAALQRAVDDLERRKARLVKQLEEQDDPDGTLFQAVRGRLSEIAAERDKKLARLAHVSEPLAADDDAVDLLDAIGQADAEGLRDASDDLLRRLFDAFRLTVTYDSRTGQARCRAVVSDDTLPAIQGALDAIARGDRPALAMDGRTPPSNGPDGRDGGQRAYVCGALGRTTH
jgi:DNA invertase Pin-like site-specific DNA recombinase